MSAVRTWSDLPQTGGRKIRSFSDDGRVTGGAENGGGLLLRWGGCGLASELKGCHLRAGIGVGVGTESSLSLSHSVTTQGTKSEGPEALGIR